MGSVVHRGLCTCHNERRRVRRPTRKSHSMKTTHSRKRILAGALISAGLAVAGMGLSTGTAQAEVPPGGPYTWCPGDPPVETGNKRVNPVDLGHQHLPRVLDRLSRAGQRRQEHLGRTEPAGGAAWPGIRTSAADSGGLVLGPLRAISVPSGSRRGRCLTSASPKADFADTQASASAKFCVRAEYEVNTSCAGADLSGTVRVARAAT